MRFTTSVLGALLASLPLTYPSAALAQGIPRFDVKAYCRDVASIGGEYSASLEQGCFEIEQSAYDELKPAWPSLPVTIRSYCEEVATLGGDGSYSMLQGCIDLELSATDEVEAQTFRY